jgi:uncharacterized membrane protein
MVKKLQQSHMVSLFGKRYHQAEVNLADIITRLSGSMLFVYLHVLAFTLFFIFQPFDIAIFNIALSLEAVFLATFIMISQNREAEREEQRAEEEDEEAEEIAEDIEDIQEDFDTVQKDLTELRRVIARIESRYGGTEATREASKEPTKIPEKTYTHSLKKI